MSFNDWCKSIDQLLTQYGAAIRTNQIDPNSLRQAWTNGTSPVAFARAAHQQQPQPAPVAPVYSPHPQSLNAVTAYFSEVPKPSTFAVRLSSDILAFLGWAFWFIAFFFIGTLIFGLTGRAGSPISSNEAFSLFKTLLEGAPSVFLLFLAFMLMGSIAHWLAQKILIDWHK